MRGKALWGLLFVVPALIGGLLTAAVLLTPLPDPDNPEVTEIFDASGTTVVSKLFTEDRIEIPVVRMPKHLLNAIVAVEDDRFYKHRGIDPVGIARALYRNIRAGRVLEGGSTLTQQLARNLTFGGTRLGQQRTVLRKVKEALITVKLEYKYSKEQILGMYWNSIYLGRGAYGVERAAQTYFGKSVQPLSLTLSECALLASLPQAPEYYSRPEGLEGLRKRQNVVLDRMAEQGYVSRAEADAAKIGIDAPETFIARPKEKRTEEKVEAPYFVDYVMEELKERYPDVAARVLQGGYRMITTLDPAIQAAANEAVKAGLQNLQAIKEEPEIALVAMEPETGYIRALIGGKGAQVERNRALEPREPGSTFKPFVYAAALSTRNYVVSSTQVDTVREFPGKEAGQPWVVRNWEGKSSGKPETMRTALKKSLNTVTAAWMDTLKPGPVIEMANGVGLESKTGYPRDLTIGLGTVAVTPLQMTAAYAALANGGYRVRPIAVLRVEDRDGNVIVSQSASRAYAVDAGVTFIVSDMLKEVLRPGGTGDQGARFLGGRPAAGKSGTTDDSKDAWFMGYTPDLVAGLWTGYDDRRVTQLLGGAHVSPIWGRFMSRALAKRPYRDWTAPANVAAEEICSITKLRPNASCPVTREWYLKGTAPKQVDATVHWDQVVPQLPGVPWAPPGLLPPTLTPTGDEEAAPPAPGAPAPTEPAVTAPDAPVQGEEAPAGPDWGLEEPEDAQP